MFAAPDPRVPALLQAMDHLNSRSGRGAITLASQGIGPRRFDTKRSQKALPGQPELTKFPSQDERAPTR